MFTHNLTIGWSSGNAQISRQITKQADGERNADPVVTAGAGDFVVSLPLTVASLKSLVIFSDKDVTIKTNSAGAPDDTLAVVAGVPLIWYEGAAGANPLTTDVTTLHIANAGADDANVQIRALQDVTP